MTDTIRLADDLGQQLKSYRKAARLTKSQVAERAGKVREVIDRLESGRDVTVTSLLAVMGALKLGMHITPVGLPTMEEVAARFAEDFDGANPP